MATDTKGGKAFDSELSEKLFSVCANGKASDVDALVKLKVNLNIKNARGWTALMLAARNGHTEVARRLISAGCDVNIVNSNGQSAHDIASFWNHKDLASVLNSTVLESPAQHINFFCHHVLDTASDRRLDAEWLLAAEHSPTSKFVLLLGGLPLVAECESSLTVKTFTPEEASQCAGADLGHGCRATFLGTHLATGEHWFAVAVAPPQATQAVASAGCRPMKNLREALLLRKEDAAIAGLAASLLDWQARCIYCESCGEKTHVTEGGHKRVCLSEGCTVKTDVRNTSYPRVDPTVIMAVISPNEDAILLARGKRHPKGMWSCLAGFMEPGESIEDAVRREVHEETSVRVNRVEYHSSQPWPFPTQLMIGCVARAVTADLAIDSKELEAAAWFTRDQVLLMSLHKHPEGLFFPPHQAIAHHLISHWLRMSAKL